MKALTILQPWASLIAVGAKQIETRSWATKYRGPIAIHAGKAFPQQLKELCWGEPFRSELLKAGILMSFHNMPFGAVIAIADLVDCLTIEGTFHHRFEGGLYGHIIKNGIPFDVTGNELAFGDYTRGRYAWILANVRPIEPIPAKGMQRLWNWGETV